MKHVALIACGKTKAATARPAGELYQGDLFQKSLRYAQDVVGADAVFVLSAKYGLVPIDAVIAPYEKTLNGLPAREVRAWADRVLDQLREVADLDRDRFTVLAGANYRKHLVGSLSNYEVPMEGLMFGQQLQFLKQELENG